MIYTALTKKAMKLCFEAHKKQVDKSGMPYEKDLLRVEKYNEAIKLLESK